MLTSALRGSLLMMMGLSAAILSGCASSNAVPRPFPSPDWDAPAEKPVAPVAPAPRAPVAPNAQDAPVVPDAHRNRDALRYDGRAVAEYALGFRGVPYRMGGADPAGFDCSGLVQYVFAQYGIAVPRVVEQQYHAGDKVKDKDIKPGDLLFFSTKGSGATHVAIAIGEERFVHAPNSTGVIRVEGLASTYWSSRYVGARRVTASTTSN